VELTIRFYILSDGEQTKSDFSRFCFERYRKRAVEVLYKEQMIVCPSSASISDLVGLEWSEFDPQIHSIRQKAGGAPGLQCSSKSNIYYK
jgi:hypothetical protein